MSHSENGVNNSSKEAECTDISPYELFETIEQKNYALRTLGALMVPEAMRQFDVTSYVESTEHIAHELCNGLGILIDLYVNDLERTVEEWADIYGESDIFKLKKVAGIMEMAERGAFINNKIPDHLFKRTLDDLNLIIERGDNKKIAEILKAEFVRYSPQKIEGASHGK